MVGHTAILRGITLTYTKLSLLSCIFLLGSFGIASHISNVQTITRTHTEILFMLFGLLVAYELLETPALKSAIKLLHVTFTNYEGGVYDIIYIYVGCYYHVHNQFVVKDRLRLWVLISEYMVMEYEYVTIAQLVADVLHSRFLFFSETSNAHIKLYSITQSTEI